MKKILAIFSLVLAFAFCAPQSGAQGARYDNYALIGKLGGPVNIAVCNTGQIQGGTAGLSESGTTVTVNLTSALTLTVGQFGYHRRKFAKLYADRREFGRSAHPGFCSRSDGALPARERARHRQQSSDARFSRAHRGRLHAWLGHL